MCLSASRRGSYHTQIYLDLLGQLESLNVAKSHKNRGNGTGDAKSDEGPYFERHGGRRGLQYLPL